MTTNNRNMLPASNKIQPDDLSSSSRASNPMERKWSTDNSWLWSADNTIDRTSKCCLTSCRRIYPEGGDVILHKYPSDLALLKKWMDALPPKEGFYSSSKICERHFKKTDFIYDDLVWDARLKRLKVVKFEFPKLKRDAVPSIFFDTPCDSSQPSTSCVKSENETVTIKEEPLDVEVSAENEDVNNIQDVNIAQEYPEYISDAYKDAILKLSKEKKCISCGVTNMELFSLFEPRYNGEVKEVYANMIRECFEIELFRSEEFPNKLLMICELCILRLRDAHIFKCKIQEEQNRIRDILKSSLVTYLERAPVEIETGDVQETNSHVDHSYSIKISNVKTVDKKSYQRVESCIDRDLLKCKLCNMYFMYEAELTKHMDAHFPKSESKEFLNMDSVMKYVCNVCRRVFNSKPELFVHKNQSAECQGNPQRSKCHLCGKYFATSVCLHHHMKKAHRPEINYTCDYCNKEYTIKYHLQQHIANQACLMDFRCFMCKKMFFHQKNFQLFICAHGNLNDLTCRYCNKKFKTKVALYVHMVGHESLLQEILNIFRVNVNGHKRFVCEHCKKCIPSTT